jgi:hypothetical protein
MTRYFINFIFVLDLVWAIYSFKALADQDLKKVYRAMTWELVDDS